MTKDQADDLELDDQGHHRLLDSKAASASTPSPWVDFVAGTAAGLASLLAGHPFDTIKTRLQTQQSQTQVQIHARSSPKPLPSPAPPTPTPPSSSVARTISKHHHLSGHYRNSFQAFLSITRYEGFRGLYKGVTSPLLGVSVMNSTIFGSYNLALVYISSSSSSNISSNDLSITEGPSKIPGLNQVMLAGMVSGVVSSLITTPIELLKIREQMDTTTNPSSSSRSTPSPSSRWRTWKVLKEIWSKSGPRGLYRGLGPTMIRDLGYGPYFWSYELLCRQLSRLKSRRLKEKKTSTSTTSDVSFHGDAFDPKNLGPCEPWTSKTPAHEPHHLGSPPSTEKLTNLELALAGGLAGCLAWLSTFWADVVKTKIQASEAPSSLSSPSSSKGDPWFKRGGSFEFARVTGQTYSQGGLRALFAGLGPTMLRALPVNAVMFVAFEGVKDTLISLGW
ncbi:mitochondrial carrier [Violaceomyces palustris]|uniref:Mitochondrial carrier n=1 Tax=Violaceomyces palustris TaxID=1673888 RepID=A0ACD0P8K9_9BASI|nr:mitochondrial carrier [Violaceomyces palustris]